MVVAGERFYSTTKRGFDAVFDLSVLTVGVFVGQDYGLEKEKRLWRLCRSASRRLGQAQQNKRPQRDQAGDMDADEPTELLVDLLPQFAPL